MGDEALEREKVRWCRQSRAQEVVVGLAIVRVANGVSISVNLRSDRMVHCRSVSSLR